MTDASFVGLDSPFADVTVLFFQPQFHSDMSSCVALVGCSYLQPIAFVVLPVSVVFSCSTVSRQLKQYMIIGLL